MAERKRIGLREVRTLGPGAELWDSAVPGFGARRQVGPTVSYVLMYRTREGRQRRFTLGRHAVAAVTRADVEQFMHAVAEGKSAARVKTKRRGLARVRGGRGTATRAVGLLGAIFTYAVRRGLRPDNPARGVIRFADGRR